LRDFRRFVLWGEKPDFPVTRSLAEYVTLDLKRPWFVVDKGCSWRDGACLDQATADEFMANLDRTLALFDKVHEDDGFMILKRKKQ